MDNPETLAALCTQDTGRRQAKHKNTTQHNTTQKVKKMSKTDPSQNQRWI